MDQSYSVSSSSRSTPIKDRLPPLPASAASSSTTSGNNDMRRPSNASLSLRTQSDSNNSNSSNINKQAYTQSGPSSALASPTAILDAYGRPSIDSIAAALISERYVGGSRRTVTEDEENDSDNDDNTAFSQCPASEAVYDEDATIRFPAAPTRSHPHHHPPPNTFKNLPKPPRPPRIRPLSQAISVTTSASSSADNNPRPSQDSVKYASTIDMPPSSVETAMPNYSSGSASLLRTTSSQSQIVTSSASSSSRPASLVVNNSCSTSSVPSPLIDISSASSSAASSYFVQTPGLLPDHHSSQHGIYPPGQDTSKVTYDDEHLLGRSTSQHALPRSTSFLTAGSGGFTEDGGANNTRASVYTTHTSASDWARERETEMRNSRSGVFDLEYDLRDSRSGSSHEEHDLNASTISSSRSMLQHHSPSSVRRQRLVNLDPVKMKGEGHEISHAEAALANHSILSSSTTSGFIAISEPASPATHMSTQSQVFGSQQTQQQQQFKTDERLPLPPVSPVSPTSPNSAGFGLGITSDDAIHPVGMSLPPSTTASPDSLTFNDDGQLPDQPHESLNTSSTSAPKSRWSTTRAYIRRNTASSVRSLHRQQSKSSLLDTRSPSFPSLQHSSSCTSLSEQYGQHAKYDETTSTGYTSESDRAAHPSPLSQFTHHHQQAAHPNPHTSSGGSYPHFEGTRRPPGSQFGSVYASNANSYLSTESILGDDMEELLHGDRHAKNDYEALQRGLTRGPNNLHPGGGSTRPASQAVEMAESGKGRVTRIEPYENIEELSIPSDTTHLIFSGVSQPVSLSNLLSSSLPGLADRLLVLDISNCSLSSIPQSIFLCSNLEELNMSGNLQISGSLPHFISSLVSLRVLLADSCALNSISHTFGNLRHLHTLALRNNNLKYLPCWFSRLSDSLELLLLEDNPFHGDYADLVKSCSRIQDSPNATEVPSPQASAAAGADTFDTRDTSLLSDASVRENSSESQEGQDVLAPGKMPAAAKSPRVSLLSRTSSVRLALGRSFSAVDDHFSSQSSSPVHSLLLADISSQASTARRRASILKPMKSMGDLSASQPSIHELVSNDKDRLQTLFPTSPAFFISPSFSETSTMDSDRSSRPSPSLIQGQPSFRKSIAGSFAARRSRKSSRGMTALDFIASEVADARGSQPPPNFAEAVSSTNSASPVVQQNTEEKAKEGRPGFFKKLSMATRRRKSNTALNTEVPIQADLAPPLPPLSLPAEQSELGLGRPPFLNNTSLRSNSAPDMVGSKRPSSARDTAQDHLPPMPMPRSVTGLPKSASGTWQSSIQSSFMESSRRYRKKSRPPIPEPLLELGQKPEPPKPSRRRSYLMLDSVLPPVISPGPLALIFDPSHGEDQTIHAKPQLQTLAEEQSPTTERSTSQQATAAPSVSNSPAVPNYNWPTEKRKAALAPLLAYLRDLDDLSRSSETKQADSAPTFTRRTDSSRLPQRKASSTAVSVVSSLQPDRSSGYESSRADSTGLTSPSSTQGPTSKIKDDPNKRERVIDEIIASEKSYLSSLQDLVALYIVPASAPLRENSRETVVPQTERVLIFSVAESITQFHSSVLLPELQNAARHLTGGERDSASSFDHALLRQTAVSIAKVFIEHAAFMKLYHSYTVNFSTALDRLALWNSFKSSSSATATPPLSSAAGQKAGVSLNANQRKRIRHLMKIARKDPKHAQVDLGGYLLMPIQRIPRYKMLLEALLECTPMVDAPDQGEPVIAAALEAMSNLATEMNERKRDNEGRQRLAQLSRFKSPLVQPHRTVLREGQMLLERVVKRDNAVIANLTAPMGPEEAGSSSLLQIPVLKVDRTRRKLIYVLCNDILILILDTEGSSPAADKYETFTVLRLGKSLGGRDQPASTFGRPDRLRIVEDRAILYLFSPDAESAQTCRDLINRQSLQTGLNYRFMGEQARNSEV